MLIFYVVYLLFILWLCQVFTFSDHLCSKYVSLFKLLKSVDLQALLDWLLSKDQPIACEVALHLNILTSQTTFFQVRSTYLKKNL